MSASTNAYFLKKRTPTHIFFFGYNSSKTSSRVDLAGAEIVCWNANNHLCLLHAIVKSTLITSIPVWHAHNQKKWCYKTANDDEEVINFGLYRMPTLNVLKLGWRKLRPQNSRRSPARPSVSLPVHRSASFKRGCGLFYALQIGSNLLKWLESRW